MERWPMPPWVGQNCWPEVGQINWPLTQAKRYARNKAISESKVRDFVGALKGGTRGVFITTSRFTKEAITYAKDQQQKVLVLIDGEKLSQLMIDYSLGVQKTYTFSTFRLDSDYLGESDF